MPVGKNSPVIDWRVATTESPDVGGAALPAGADERATPGYNAVNKTTARTLRVLTAFLESPGTGFRVAELCRRLNIPKQSMIRALRMLMDEGYICKRQQGAGYDLGYRVVELGNFDQIEPELLEIALPFMQRMHSLTGETVVLLSRVGDYASVVEHIDGRWPLPSFIRKGRPMLLNVGAVSASILANLADAEVHDFIARHTPLPAIAPNSISDPERLWESIRTVRGRGYGLGPVMTGIATIGFPVFGAEEKPHGAVSLIGHEEQILALPGGTVLETLQRMVGELNEQTRLFHAAPNVEVGL
jgi:DNA-binding IclR family transcriptional regulator